MQNIITQVSPDDAGPAQILRPSQDYESYDSSETTAYGNSLIHLNIQEHHYFITRDQLMSLPESLLLCLFPSGVFLDREGQVISNLTPNDEVYIVNFSPECFEYIMRVFREAHDDLINYPVERVFSNNSGEGLFGLGLGGDESIRSSDAGSSSIISSSGSSEFNGEHNILHQKPAIIVLREDLDYYCVPQQEFRFVAQDGSVSKGIDGNDGVDDMSNVIDRESERENNDDLLHHFMSQVKVAAGSYLSEKTSVFQGLFSSNRLRDQTGSLPKASTDDINAIPDVKLGPAEQHLMDMLCSSGFTRDSQWGNRTQEVGKTVISSLSLCRLANETTRDFRARYEEAKNRWIRERLRARGMNGAGAFISGNQSSSTATRPWSWNPEVDSESAARSKQGHSSLRSSESIPNLNLSSSPKRERGKPSGFARFKEGRLLHPSLHHSEHHSGGNSKGSSGNVKYNNENRNDSNEDLDLNSIYQELPRLYDLVPKPQINTKLLLFWRKPARKCWWGEEEINLDVDIYGNWADEMHKVIKLKLPDPSSEDPMEGLNRIRVPVRLHIRRVWTLELSVVGV